MSDSLNSRVRTFEADVEKVHLLVHGTAEASVPTESGQLRTFAGLQATLIAQYDAAANRTEAVQSRLAAESAASAAAVGAAQAEAARDAALLSAGVFADLAAGQAAAAEGAYFSVPSTEGAEHLVLYRRTATGADEIKRYPSAAALESVREMSSTAQLTMAASMVITQAEVVAIRNDLDSLGL